VTRPSESFALPRAPVAEGFPGRVDFVKSASKLGEAPVTTLPEVAFCGRSNVGKSSLINTLCNRRQLARVSNTPGRTRLLNFFDVQQRVMLVDLPGYGFATGNRAEVAAWGQTIQDYLQNRKQLVLSLMLLDARREAEREEEELLMWFQASGVPTVVILTKADKLNKSELERARVAAARTLRLPRSQVLPFSALTRDGRDAVWGTILGVVAGQAGALAERLAAEAGEVETPAEAASAGVS
jgi:GTP-binding protein